MKSVPELVDFVLDIAGDHVFPLLAVRAGSQI